MQSKLAYLTKWSASRFCARPTHRCSNPKQRNKTEPERETRMWGKMACICRCPLSPLPAMSYFHIFFSGRLYKIKALVFVILGMRLCNQLSLCCVDKQLRQIPLILTLRLLVFEIYYTKWGPVSFVKMSFRGELSYFYLSEEVESVLLWPVFGNLVKNGNKCATSR